MCEARVTHLIGNVEPEQRPNGDQHILHDDPPFNPAFPLDDPYQLFKSPRKRHNLLQVRVPRQEGRKEQERLVPEHFTGARAELRLCARDCRRGRRRIKYGEDAIDARWRRRDQVCLNDWGAVEEELREELEGVEAWVEGCRCVNQGEQRVCWLGCL